MCKYGESNAEYEEFKKVEDEYWAVLVRCRSSNTLFALCLVSAAFMSVLAVLFSVYGFVIGIIFTKVSQVKNLINR